MKIKIREVREKKEKKAFIEFPLRLYQNNPCFVPPLYSDEKKIFNDDYFYLKTCEAVYYLAYDENDNVVGRISGILQKVSNQIRNEKRVRFTRFDCIDDKNVAHALFSSLENWAVSKGMDTVVGPLGFSDLEREGLLVEGFDMLSTFEEQYNYPYYAELIESEGYVKEVDWVESRISLPKEDDHSVEKLADYVMKRYNLHFGTARNIKDWIKKYKTAFFTLLDKSYADVYGSVPFTEEMKDSLISNFSLILDLNHIAVVLDENEKPVCMGLCFPSLSKAVRKSGGRLTPLTLLRIMHDVKHPKIIDLGLIGVDPEYLNRGISIVFASELKKMLIRDKIEYAETNLNLENNYSIRNLWKRFHEVQHKRRRSYVKKLYDQNNY